MCLEPGRAGQCSQRLPAAALHIIAQHLGAQTPRGRRKDLTQGMRATRHDLPGDWAVSLNACRASCSPDIGRRGPGAPRWANALHPGPVIATHRLQGTVAQHPGRLHRRLKTGWASPGAWPGVVLPARRHVERELVHVVVQKQRRASLCPRISPEPCAALGALADPVPVPARFRSVLHHGGAAEVGS